MGELVTLPILTPEQRVHWERQLAASLKAVEVARHALGIDLILPETNDAHA
jgi:hypothetical protein